MKSISYTIYGRFSSIHCASNTAIITAHSNHHTYCGTTYCFCKRIRTERPDGVVVKSVQVSCRQQPHNIEDYEVKCVPLFVALAGCYTAATAASAMHIAAAAMAAATAAAAVAAAAAADA